VIGETGSRSQLQSRGIDARFDYVGNDS
jgi:hypothetical protein